MNTATQKATGDPVAEAARKALTKANGDVRKATDILEHAVRSDRKLRDLLTDPLISSACYDAVRRVCHAERRAVWKAPIEKLVKGRLTGSARVVKLAAGNLLMFSLPDGLKLGEATREDITEAANFYSKQAGDMAHKSRWLQLIAQSLPAGKKVREVLTDRRLRELQQEAKRG